MNFQLRANILVLFPIALLAVPRAIRTRLALRTPLDVFNLPTRLAVGHTSRFLIAHVFHDLLHHLLRRVDAYRHSARRMDEHDDAALGLVQVRARSDGSLPCASAAVDAPLTGFGVALWLEVRDYLRDGVGEEFLVGGIAVRLG